MGDFGITSRERDPAFFFVGVKRSGLRFLLLLLRPLRIGRSPRRSRPRGDLRRLRNGLILAGTLRHAPLKFQVVKPLFYKDTSKDRNGSPSPVSMKSKVLVIVGVKSHHYLFSIAHGRES
jgi:hypothetical protein